MPFNSSVKDKTQWITALLFSLPLLFGCGGGGSDPGGGTSPPPPEPDWAQSTLLPLSVGGLTAPWGTAKVDSSGHVHLAFFEQTGTAETPNGISYLVYDPSAPEDAASVLPELAVEIDNSSGLSLTLDNNDQPLLFYQGGGLRECGSPSQSDAMFSQRSSSGWSEYTAAIGDNPRNPVFRDGLAGTSLAAAVDSQGRQHLVYQLYYEGCDAMNFRYPDLRYVVIDPANPGATPMEETVEGNLYLDLGDDRNEQNNVGDKAVITFDQNDDPVVFYYAELADGSMGLRVARRVAGQWQTDWVEQDCEIGHLSAARSPLNHRAGVAYYVRRYTNGQDDLDCLRYAEENSSGWTLQMVEDSRRVGEYCSLAFAVDDSPLIAYREMSTFSGFSLQNLKLATRSGSSWYSEVVAEVGDIGLFNSLWVDADGVTRIISYSNTTHSLYQFQK